MKTITIQIKDKTAEALEKAIQTRYYYNYPIEQAYSLVIDELLLEIQDLQFVSHSCCCYYVPPHNHPLAWCI